MTSSKPDPIERLLERQLEMQQRIFQALTRIERNLAGFTDDGASFRAHQVDPLQLAATQMVAPVIGDRIDGRLVGKENQDFDVRRDRLARAACMASRDMLAVIDQYRAEKQAPDMIERLFTSPDANERTSPDANERSE